LNPKPVRKDVPILIGGESEAALRRTARVGDGWFPYKLKVEDAAARIAYLKQITREQGRDPDAFRIAAPLFESSAIDDLKRFRDAGVTEFYLGIFPEQAMDDAQLDARIAALGERFVEPLSSW
jgi:alkanesulfonate monooxygenase SsuD/methylene tetrahydromethanopterin reductase-like flavin-dependent oxidoreductase (luciferase family)